ncbi:hypothetical protein J6U76_03765, partial [bacterium]|nr:hypothetical protein [bacterium]
MKKLFLLLTIACATVAFAENQTLFSIDFEEGEGFTAGSVTGQVGWTDLAWWVGTHSFVIADESGAQSGSQYLHVAEDGDSNANQQNNTIDISEEYTEGMKLLLHGW